MSLLSEILILVLAWQLLQLILKDRLLWRLDGPEGRLIRADASFRLKVPSSALFAKKFRVRGVPDYVYEDPPSLLALLVSKMLGRKSPQMTYMPVEAKSATVRNFKESDRFQLLTQCFLLEENGLIVNRGRLVYANNDFYFPYGPTERQEVLRVLEEMREAEKVNDLQCFAPVHDQRCRGCEFRTVCFGEKRPC